MKTLELNDLEEIKGGDASNIADGICLAVLGAGIAARIGIIAITGGIGATIFTALQIGCLGYAGSKAF